MRKAGFLEIGETAAGIAVRDGAAKLVLLAGDAPQSAASRAERMLSGKRALLLPLPYSRDELSALWGKGGCSIAAVTDIGLAAAFLSALAEEAPDRYAQAACEIKRRSEKAAKRKALGPKRKAGRNDQ